MSDGSFSNQVASIREEEGLFARDVNGELIRLEKATEREYDQDVALTIDGQAITVKKAVPSTDSQGNIIKDMNGQTVPRRTTIYDAATELLAGRSVAAGQQSTVNPIPILCHQEHLRPVAVCRICSVEVCRIRNGREESSGKLVPACFHPAEPGMIIHTIDSPNEAARERVRRSVRVLAELLAADHLNRDRLASQAATPNELRAILQRLGISTSRFRPSPLERGRDESSHVIKIDHDSCILCDRCVRACDEVKQNLVIGRTGKGYSASIGFDLDSPMGESSCVSCGECMISCPTDALMFRNPVVPKPPQGDIVSPADLKAQYPLFAGIPDKFLQWNASSVVRRQVKVGEVLCREGEYGSTAFIMTRGSFDISLQVPLSHVQNDRAKGWRGILGRITSGLVARVPTAVGGNRTIRSDSGAPLTYDKPFAVRTPDDLILGEMTCMNHYPRSATVTAREDGEVLEIRRNVLYLLQRNKISREILDRVYRTRALASHLEQLSFFQKMDEKSRLECVAFLRDRVELTRVDPGQIIFRQGEVADHFYLVRLGFVKVAQSLLGEERVRDYLGPGNYFGEIGLLSNLSDLIAKKVPAGLIGRRTATCSALDDVELVRIRGDDFRRLLDQCSELREHMVRWVLDILERDETDANKVGQSLGQFLDDGLFQAQKLLVLDLESCTRCDECTRACADTHGGVTRLVREGVRFDKFLIASSCRSCLDPYCLVGCPVDAIHREGSLEITIEDHCIGCGLCAQNCPYGNINMHGFEQWRNDPAQPGKRVAVVQQKATTCDLCRNVVGENEEVSCVHACPHNAAFRMSGKELINLVNLAADPTKMPHA